MGQALASSLGTRDDVLRGIQVAFIYIFFMCSEAFRSPRLDESLSYRIVLIGRYLRV